MLCFYWTMLDFWWYIITKQTISQQLPQQHILLWLIAIMILKQMELSWFLLLCLELFSFFLLYQTTIKELLHMIWIQPTSLLILQQISLPSMVILSLMLLLCQLQYVLQTSILIQFWFPVLIVWLFVPDASTISFAYLANLDMCAILKVYAMLQQINPTVVEASLKK